MPLMMLNLTSTVAMLDGYLLVPFPVSMIILNLHQLQICNGFNFASLKPSIKC